ncbi:Alpha/Beta hydrolase protein, partial [Zopfochytrium polystomum]
VQIYYELFGTGPRRLLLISGLGATSAAWYTTITRLQALYAGQLSILVIDNRGIGFSTSDSGHLAPFSIKDMALDCEQVMDHVGWGRSPTSSGDGEGCCEVNLVGHSMGGMIAQELLLLPSAKRRFRAAVLISTAAARPTMPSWDFVVHAVKKPIGAGATASPPNSGDEGRPAGAAGAAPSDEADTVWRVELVHPPDWLDQPALT